MPSPTIPQKPLRRIIGNPPSVVWERSGNFDERGHALWVSREWKSGEKAAYCRDVLNYPIGEVSVQL